MFCNNSVFHVSSVKEIKSCAGVFIYLEGSEFRKPYEINYQKPEQHNLDNCPHCKAAHADLIVRAQELFENFPNCCEYHKKLTNEVWFNKEEYRYFTKTIADKIFFTKHHLYDVFDTVEDWQTEVDNYLEYVAHSLGSFPVGYGAAFGVNLFYPNLINHIKGSRTIENKSYWVKLDYILNLIELKYYSINPVKQPIISNTYTNFNLLMSIYSKWFKLFPFDLKLFAHLKDKYSKTLPLLAEKPIPNPYLGISKAKLITQDELGEVLYNITKNITSSIDTRKLLQDNYITDQTRYSLDLSNEKYRLNNETLYKSYTKKEIQYIQFLKRWLKNEKDYISEVTPILQITEKATQTEHKPVLDTIWTTDEQLKEIHTKLNNNLFKVELDSFIHWFGSCPCSQPKKIRWVYKNRNKRALSYFVEKISVSGKIDFAKSRNIFDVQIKNKDMYQTYFPDLDELLGAKKPTAKIKL